MEVTTLTSKLSKLTHTELSAAEVTPSLVPKQGHFRLFLHLIFLYFAGDYSIAITQVCVAFWVWSIFSKIRSTKHSYLFFISLMDWHRKAEQNFFWLLCTVLEIQDRGLNIIFLTKPSSQISCKLQVNSEQDNSMRQFRAGKWLPTSTLFCWKTRSTREQSALFMVGKLVNETLWSVMSDLGEM